MECVALKDWRGSDNPEYELELSKICLNQTTIQTQHVQLMQQGVSINGHERSYVHTVSNNEEGKDLIIYYHGSRGNAWMSALNETRWIEHSNDFIIVFGQAEGTVEQPHIHDHYKYISYGELYWEIRDNAKQFQNDLSYTDKIISDMKQKYNIDRVFFCRP